MGYVPSSVGFSWPCYGPCEPPWGSTAPGLARPSRPFPGRGSRLTHRPSEGHSAQLQLQPLPLTR